MFFRLSSSLLVVACTLTALTAAAPNNKRYVGPTFVNPYTTTTPTTGSSSTSIVGGTTGVPGDNGDPSAGPNGFNGYTGQYNGIYNQPGAPTVTGSDTSSNDGTSTQGTSPTGSTSTGTTTSTGTGTTGTGTTTTTGTGTTGSGTTGTGTTGTTTTGTTTTPNNYCPNGGTAQCCGTVGNDQNSVIAGLLASTGVADNSATTYGANCVALSGTCSGTPVCCQDTSNAQLSVSCAAVSF